MLFSLHCNSFIHTHSLTPTHSFIYLFVYLLCSFIIYLNHSSLGQAKCFILWNFFFFKSSGSSRGSLKELAQKVTC